MNATLINQYFTYLSDQQHQQFEALDGLYRTWNEKINVVSRKDIDHLYERHILHSLGIAKLIEFVDGSYVLDIGTGGGFPGIPLAILFPNTQFLLADSIGKKITVVKEVYQSLGLCNVKAVQVRGENIDDSFDFVVSRAVTALPKFMTFIKGKIKKEQKNAIPNGLLYLKGGDFSDELRTVNRKSTVTPLSDYFSEPFFESKKVVHIPL